MSNFTKKRGDKSKTLAKYTIQGMMMTSLFKNFSKSNFQNLTFDGVSSRLKNKVAVLS